MSVTQPTHSYDFRVASTTSVSDQMGSGGTATYQGSAVSTTADGVVLDNSDNTNGPKYVSITPPTISDATHSIEIYFKLTTDIASYAMITSFNSTSGNVERWISTTGTSDNRFQNNNTTSSTGVTTLYNDTNPTAGTLYHAVVTFEKNGNTAFYINNATTGTSSTSTMTTFSYTTGSWELGRRAKLTNNYADIAVHYVRWWDGYALSTSDVASLYTNRAIVNYSNWKPVTIPTYDWNFRQALSNGSTVTDQFSQETLTLDGPSATVADGASVTQLEDHIDFGDTTITVSPTFTMEMYWKSGSTRVLTGSTDYCFLWMLQKPEYSASHAFTVRQDNGGNYMVKYPKDETANNVTSQIHDVAHNWTANTTYHFVLTFTPTTSRMYVNNVLLSTETLSTPFNNGVTANHGGSTSALMNKPSASWATLNGDIYYWRLYDSELTIREIDTLYANRETNYFNFTNMRINYGDVYLAQTLNKTLADYRSENIPLNDVSFAAFPINKFKETYILGDVDISGDTILRSNTTYFTDISADTFDVSGNLLMSDLSANSSFSVGGDVSFNSNVTIHGDLSFGGDVSFNGTFTRAQASIGSGSGLLMNTDLSMNANLEFNGATTIKNDLHFNAYSDVSANPVLTDGTLLHNQKMEKLDHRYLLDISRSSPFSTLNYNTLPSNIYDNSTNSGICISGDGKYIRTVNLSDVSANATSFYSNDYGSSFNKDESLSYLLTILDVSLNDNGNNYLGSPPLTKFGADKVYMSYNGQHQLVPRGWSVQPSLADFLYVSNDFGNTWNIRKSAEVSTTTHSYTVTANGSSNYIFSSTNYTIHQQGINMYLNESVQFTIDTTTNGNHPFKIGTSANGGEITDSTITSVTSGSNQIITFKPTTSGTFYYYCSAHSGMGNSIIVEEQNGNFGKGWNWYSGAVSADGKYMFVSGNEGMWRSQDFGTNWYNTANDMSLNNITISSTGQHVYGIVEREVYGSSDYGSSFSKIYTDPSAVAFDFSTIASSGNDIWKTMGSSTPAQTLPVGGYMGFQNSTSYDGRFHMGRVGLEVARNYPIQQVRNADPNNTDARRTGCVFYYDDTVDNGFKPDQTDWTNYTSYRNGSGMSGSGKYLWVRSTLTTNGGPNVFIRSEDYGNTWLMDSTFNGVNPNVDMNNTDMTWTAEGCIASNFEGDRVINFGGQDGMWFSIDYGRTWGPFGYDANKNPHSSITVNGTTYTSLPTGGANVGYMGSALSMSENGQYILYCFGRPANASYSNECAFLSTDYGLTFTVVAVNSTLNAFGEYATCSCDMSRDGQYMGLVVAADATASNAHRGLYISQDYGSTWTQKFTSTDWLRRSDFIMSGDAKIMVYNHRVNSGETSSNSYVKISVDYGSTWTSPYATVTDGSTPDGTNNFPIPAMHAQAMSKNGQYFYIAGSGYLTTGVTPYQTPPFSKIETSGNGKYITIADVVGSNIYMSSDYGNSFDLKSPPADDYTNLAIPTPAYDWDFRQVATTGVNSNGSTIQYLGGLTSDATNGASFTANAGEYMIVDNVPIPAAFSIEMYYYLDTLVGQGNIFSIYSPSSGDWTDHMSSGHSYWYENNQWNSIWRETAKINGVNSTTVNGWRSVSGITGNTWYHRVIVFNGSTWQHYQNGVVGQHQSHTHVAQNYSIGIMGNINGSNVGSNFKWKCFRVYNSALTADDVTNLYNLRETSTVGAFGNSTNTSLNCGISHSGKIVLNSNYISYDYGNNFHLIPDLISTELSNRDTFYSKANMEYLLNPSNNLMLSIPYKSAQFQDIYSVGSIKVGTTTYSSDYRIKENVEELGEEDTVNELRPVKYYNTNLKRNDYGLIAHELQEKYPFLVSGEKDGNEPQSINYNGLISLLVHEVKNLKKEYLELKEMKK